MNILLQGKRITQRKIGHGMTSEFVKQEHTFVCIAEDVGVRALGDFESIHLKATEGVVTGLCCACGFYDTVYAHFEEDEAERWSNHPRRCNYAYVP